MHQNDLSLFNELHGCYLQQWGFTVSFWVEISCLGWSDFQGTTWTAPQLSITQSWDLVTKDNELRIPSPSLFENFVRISLIYLRKFPLYQVSIPPFKCPSILAVSLHIWFLNPILLPPNLILLFQSLPHKIYSSFLSREILVYSLVFSMGIWIIDLLSFI